MKNNVNKILVLFFVTLAIGFPQDNYSLSFDGQDDQLDIPMTNVRSLAFWVKVSSDNTVDNGDSYIIDARPGLGYSWLEPYRPLDLAGVKFI